MIGPVEETPVWNKKKENVDLLFLLRSDYESKYLDYRDHTKIRTFWTRILSALSSVLI